MKTVAVIPARMSSTRFPGKPLADILGLPMIEHVRRRTALCSDFLDVVVATCDREIFDVVVKNGGKAIMTSKSHERCTDRVAEAVRSVDADVVVNVQGDEPLVHPDMFPPLLRPLQQEPSLPCTNLMARIDNEDDFRSTHVVKTVCDPTDNALYFSREPIPSASKAAAAVYDRFMQTGLIAFRKDFLQVFAALPPTPLEGVESVDMLRAIEHGFKVRMVLTPIQVVGVDTQDDLRRVVDLMKCDRLYGHY